MGNEFVVVGHKELEINETIKKIRKNEKERWRKMAFSRKYKKKKQIRYQDERIAKDKS